ncbi:unnamed protein product [Diamesa hyperborea]
MYRRTTKLKITACLIVMLLTLIVTINFEIINQFYQHNEVIQSQLVSYNNKLIQANQVIYPVVTNYEKKNWHDYDFINYEAQRVGPGENGTAYFLTDPEDIQRNDELFVDEGLYAVVSDKISLNRTPHELIHEIILVNDASDRDELYEPLAKYVEENFHGMVKILNLKDRKGLIVTRMEGAKIATGEVLVFFDSHIEVNTNWLPPLIEPIALNPRTSTQPVIDKFNPQTFEYEIYNENGERGVFDWHFVFIYLNLKPEDLIDPSLPHETPLMLGCAFAINRQYFWDLGGYDDQLLIWNGENYELSFKLWLCGGKLLEVPCSRVAHTFRKHFKFRKLDGVDFEYRNFKRVAEVWMDDWKEHLYIRNPERYAKIDAGDLTKQKAIRKQLNCLPFDYFMYYVAPELSVVYPVPNAGDFAYGYLKTESDTKYCIDSGGKDKRCIIYQCHDETGWQQFFHLTKNAHVEHHTVKSCLNIPNSETLENDQWNYNPITHQLEQDTQNNNTLCITADLENKSLVFLTCDSSNDRQKWLWETINKTAINQSR